MHRLFMGEVLPIIPSCGISKERKPENRMALGFPLQRIRDAIAVSVSSAFYFSLNSELNWALSDGISAIRDTSTLAFPASSRRSFQ